MGGANRVCAQCQLDCKQFKQVTLMACPKFLPIDPKKYPKRRPYRHATTLEGVPKRAIAKISGGIPKTVKSHPKRSAKAEASNKRCPICLMLKATSNHHIKPIEQGGLDKPRNRVALCPPCHNIVEEYAEVGKYYSPALVKEIRLTCLG